MNQLPEIWSYDLDNESDYFLEELDKYVSKVYPVNEWVKYIKSGSHKAIYSEKNPIGMVLAISSSTYAKISREQFITLVLGLSLDYEIY